jgi:hypothetical protein
MLIARVIGGLGNQMFQYAFVRALSLTRNVHFLVDTSDFPGYGLHQGYELPKVFACDPNIATNEQLSKFIGWRAIGLARRIFMRPSSGFMRGRCFVVEPHFHYWEGAWRVPNDCYLVGYWQSERYFLEVESTIRADFKFCSPVTGHNTDWVTRINRAESVSLHIRRGDYVTDSKTHETHGVCTLEYYLAAIKYIAEHVEEPEFFVFSDDMRWVRDNLRTDVPCHYVDCNRGAESYNDMRLMSMCKHHIIANSSFSWWGAWLNPRSDKIVIAPAKWFANDKVNVEDLYPAGWIKI